MIWTVHRGPAGDTKVVPEGAAKWALVFGSLWLAWHRLWWEALVFLLLTLLVNRVADLAFDGRPNVALILTFALALLPRLWLLLEGNEMRRAKLARAGHVCVGVVEAADQQSALVRGAREARLTEPGADVLPASAA